MKSEQDPPQPTKFHHIARKQASPTTKEYKRLRMENFTFVPGDTVVINEYYDAQSYGTILKIWGLTHQPTESYATIRWFYKPQSVFNQVPSFIGADELFDSDHEDNVYVQTIGGMIKVISIDDYFALDTVPDEVFYCRAKYVSRQLTLEPDINEWRKVCYCGAIMCPDEIYRECGGCRQLFHPICVEAESVENIEFKCRQCSK